VAFGFPDSQTSVVPQDSFSLILSGSPVRKEVKEGVLARFANARIDVADIRGSARLARKPFMHKHIYGNHLQRWGPYIRLEKLSDGGHVV